MSKKIELINKANDYYSGLSGEAKYIFDEIAGLFQYDNNMTEEEATIEAYLQIITEETQ